jgi:hypothetical protein
LQAVDNFVFIDVVRDLPEGLVRLKDLLFDLTLIGKRAPLSKLRQVIQNKVGKNDLIEPVIDILIWAGCLGVPTDSGIVYISDCGFKRPYIRALMRNNEAQEIVFHPTLASIFATPGAAPARSAFRREQQTDSRQGNLSL